MEVESAALPPTDAVPTGDANRHVEDANRHQGGDTPDVVEHAASQEIQDEDGMHSQHRAESVANSIEQCEADERVTLTTCSEATVDAETRLDPQDESRSRDRRSPNGRRECRICFEPEGDTEDMWLVSPCVCRGSLQWAHRGCLRRWAMEVGHFRCDICKTEQALPSGSANEPPLFPEPLRAYVARVALRRDLSQRRRMIHAAAAAVAAAATAPAPAHHVFLPSQQTISPLDVEQGRTPRTPGRAREHRRGAAVSTPSRVRHPSSLASTDNRRSVSHSNVPPPPSGPDHGDLARQGGMMSCGGCMLWLVTGGGPRQPWSNARTIHTVASLLFLVVFITLIVFLAYHWIGALNDTRRQTASKDTASDIKAAKYEVFSASGALPLESSGNHSNGSCLNGWVCAIGHMHFAGGVLFERGTCESYGLRSFGAPCGHWGRYEVEHGCTHGVGSQCVLRLMPSTMDNAVFSALSAPSEPSGDVDDPTGGFCDIMGRCRSGGLRTLVPLAVGGGVARGGSLWMREVAPLAQV